MASKTVHLSRGDLVKYNLFVLPRISTYLRVLAVIWAIMIYLHWSGRDAATFEWNVALFLTTFAQAIGAFLLWYTVLLIFVLKGAKHNGLIGDTDYSLEEEGFRYVTDSTNSITRWESIAKAKIYAGMIVVELSGYIFCLLPRHQFESDHEFESFFKEIEERRRIAQSAHQ